MGQMDKMWTIASYFIKKCINNLKIQQNAYTLTVNAKCLLICHYCQFLIDSSERKHFEI